jgi:hypothetical protein
MTRDGIHNLGIRDTEELAEYLLYHISMELRGKLMAERPVLYSRLFPTVTPENLAFRVSDTIHHEREDETPKRDFGITVTSNERGIRGDKA